MTFTRAEIMSQAEMWKRAVELLPEVADNLPRPGSKALFVGCGTSAYISEAAAVLREAGGHGETDARIASEASSSRNYDLVVGITRSGTTTELLDALTQFGDRYRTLVIAGAPDSPALDLADDAILLDFADEESVVQTRFATTTLALLRAHFGEDLGPAIADVSWLLGRPLPVDPSEFEHFVFLGRGWGGALATEAALKFRETARAWSEAYLAPEYRHGPISVAGQRSLVWILNGAEPRLVSDIEATGATVVAGSADPMAELAAIQLAALTLAEARGIDPDQPRHLARSVVLR